MFLLILFALLWCMLILQYWFPGMHLVDSLTDSRRNGRLLKFVDAARNQETHSRIAKKFINLHRFAVT